MEKEPITLQGLEKIKSELDERKHTTRSKIVMAISEARSHGDLKENAEYHAAKEEQGLNEKRIQELETSIAMAEVIDIRKIPNDNKVIFASTIIVKDLDNDKKNTYKIVGRDEADVKNGLIYYKSPLGRGFIGKNKEDFVVIETPSGEKNFEILDVKYI
ncbi:transcription elongation factor GreA [bacterium]|jgi:transcription elongation factor GreA|nr:transcription elongation factor GreA [bacterium]MDC0425874.1 transcription elongation factor GreA [Pelagibacteraceae bacterium]